MTRRSPEEYERLAAEFEQWVDNLDLDDPNVVVRPGHAMRAVARAAEAVRAAEEALTAAVVTAEAAGHGWGMIGLMLDLPVSEVRRRYEDECRRWSFGSDEAGADRDNETGPDRDNPIARPRVRRHDLLVIYTERLQACREFSLASACRSSRSATAPVRCTTPRSYRAAR